MDSVWLTVAVTSIVPVITNAVRYNARVNDQSACDHFSSEETCFFRIICIHIDRKGMLYAVHIKETLLSRLWHKLREVLHWIYSLYIGNLVVGILFTKNSEWPFIKLILIGFCFCNLLIGPRNSLIE